VCRRERHSLASIGAQKWLRFSVTLVPKAARSLTVGRFAVSGSYLLRAYPVAVGPTMPARFARHVSGGTLVLTVTVTDTVAHSDTVLGPATAILGRTPSMGPCPICRTNADRMAHRRSVATKPSS
jgi:hypothetical protein